MSYIKDGKILIEYDKALIWKNIRVSLAYGIPMLIIAVFLIYLLTRGFSFMIALILIMLIVTVGICLYGIVMNIKHLKSGAPLLEADSSGISEKSILVRGAVPWNSVKRIYLKPTSLNGKNIDYIELELFDRESYINTLGANARKMVKANIAMGHEAVAMAFVHADTEEIMNDLITLWESSR